MVAARTAPGPAHTAARGDHGRRAETRVRAAARTGGLWTAMVVALARLGAASARATGLGAGSIIGGRLALALSPGILGRLARGRAVVVVTGTNGKTTTSHLLAAALARHGSVAHNASGSNMPDGAVAALIDAPHAMTAVLEVDELHLRPVLDATRPAAVVLLNLSRDQLDRISEVRATADAIRRLLDAYPDTTVIANADDPMVVWAASSAAHTVWVAAGTRWSSDTQACPRCGHAIIRDHPSGPPGRWWCVCGLRRPPATWWWHGPAPTHPAPGDPSPRTDGAVVVHDGVRVPLALALPGQVNTANATFALAAADVLGVGPDTAAPALAAVTDVAGRYSSHHHGRHRLRLLLAKNPAGWAEALDLLDPDRPLLVVVNAREADGRDVSWLWDLPVDPLSTRAVAAAGDCAPDVAVRFGYADIASPYATDPLRALEYLPPGPVDVLANYTAFLELGRRLTVPGPPRAPAPRRPTATAP